MKELDDRSLVTHLPPVSPRTRSQSGGNDIQANSDDLELLADQLARIAEELRRSGASAKNNRADTPIPLHSQNGGTNGTTPGFGAPSSPWGLPGRPSATREAQIGFEDQLDQRGKYLVQARHLYATRRKRSTIFGNPELFGEPAWDILLDLYIAHGERKPVSVSSACIGSAAPPTTGLRWLGVLAEQDLILREHDPHDQRRVLVRLTEKGLNAMDEFFANAAY